MNREDIRPIPQLQYSQAGRSFWQALACFASGLACFASEYGDGRQYTEIEESSLEDKWPKQK